MNDFASAVLTYQGRLFRCAMKLARNKDKAEDLVQSTIENALKSQNSFRQGSDLFTWMHTIMRFKHYSNHRKSKRFVEDPDDLIAKTVLDPTADQAAALEAKQALAFINTLTPRRRDVLWLAALGAEHIEIAKELNCAEGTVKSQAHRAREALRKYMDE